MKIIRYRNLRYPPSWRSNTPLADFDFPVDKIKGALEEKLKWFSGNVALMQHAANRKTCKSLQVLVRRCKAMQEAETQLTIWPISKRDLLWWVIDGLVFEGDFASVHCLSCSTDYLPAQCKMENWSIGEDLIAEGGRRLFCSYGHMLFSCTEWNS